MIVLRTFFASVCVGGVVDGIGLAHFLYTLCMFRIRMALASALLWWHYVASLSLGIESIAGKK